MQDAPALDGGTAEDAVADARFVEAECTECLDLPQFQDGPIKPSLEVAAKVMWSRTVGVILRGRPALAGKDLVVSAANRLLFIDVGTGSVKHSIPSDGFELISPPIVDEDGNVYFHGNYLYSVTSDGNPRWLKDLSADGQIRGPVVVGVEAVYYYTSGRKLVARSTASGEVLWKMDGPDTTGRYLVSGFSTVVADVSAATANSTLYDTRDGRVISCEYAAGGSNRFHVFSAFGGEIVQEQVPAPQFGNFRVSLVDRCHRTLWTLPERTAQSAALTTIGPGLLLEDFHAEQNLSELRIVDATGNVVAGPAESGRPLLTGADGIIYTARCELYNDDARADLIALSPSLQEKWRLPIGGCPRGGVLLDSGVLLLAWDTHREEDNGVNVTAIQTTSPGLANTSWPVVWGHDNRLSSFEK